MTALDLFVAGRFTEAAEAYRRELSAQPDNLRALSGLSNSLMGDGQYDEAIRLKLRLHEYDKAENPDSPGQLLALACAYWCKDVRETAIELGRELCVSIANGSVCMAPDQAGGATFGLILHYMAVTAKDESNIIFALDYLHDLNSLYDKNPSHFRYPVATIKQVLGECRFEDALEGATSQRSLPAAYDAVQSSKLKLSHLGIALFHDGVVLRALGKENECLVRMRQVLDLGYQAELLRWQLARHELG